MGFLKNFFGGSSKGSGQIAKDRLKIVLMHDRTDITPDLMENLRKDIVKVITKYMEIDTDKIGINFEHDADLVALVASIPVKSVKRGGTIEAQNRLEAQSGL